MTDENEIDETEEVDAQTQQDADSLELQQMTFQADGKNMSYAEYRQYQIDREASIAAAGESMKAAFAEQEAAQRAAGVIE